MTLPILYLWLQVTLTGPRRRSLSLCWIGAACVDDRGDRRGGGPGGGGSAPGAGLTPVPGSGQC